ncbi:hypothetical protein VTN77DRAFT_2036 [Rasamsonia byssochlamydoides]|uniref:uncharacterized protein n=1 Tax=Rasamsonia byssochlamydoides TaxID=89139 RepID=UPI0037437388
MATAVLSAADAAQLTTLRAELKQWEKAFAAANGGRKAGRDDIKQDPEIAAKYKAYGRLRALEASASASSSSASSAVDKTPSKSESQQTKAKRKHAPDENHGFTPRKASRRELLTPSKSFTTNVHPADLDPYDSPSTLRRLFSPSTHRQSQESPLPLKTAIGPTPQRDGKVLGLFDLLSASGGSTATPSAKRVASLGKEAVQTPSKRVKMDAIEEGDEEEEEIGRLGRTPTSSSKKWYLEKLFATPTTLRYATMVEDEESGIRHNVQTTADDALEANPLQSETPSFLRRSNSGRFTSNPNPTTTDLSPVAVRKPQRFVGKGLSALVQGLRDMEEERMREDWEILREIEQEQAQAEASSNDVQVGDSQMPLNEGDGNSRPWKKRGQKRTTRLVKMKPVPSKPKPAPATSTTTTQEAENESEDELVAVAVPAQAEKVRQGSVEDKDENADDAPSNEEASDVDIDDDDDNYSAPDSDHDNDDDYDEKDELHPTKRSQKSSFSEKIKAAFSVVKRAKTGDDDKTKSKTKTKADDGEEGKKAKRKINPLAHANYRSLKLRNKGSKGQRGRFGRRR